MKRLIIFFIFTNTYLLAQTPQGINYQGVARNSLGETLPNKTISLQFELKDNSNAIVFSEQHLAITTNNLGLFGAIIGSKNASQFQSLNWSAGNLSLHVSIDINGGSAFVSVGSSQKMQSVPYSFHAESVPASYTGNILTIGKQSFTLSISAAPSLTYSNNVLSVGPSTNSVIIPSGPIPNTTLTAGTNVNVQGTHPGYTISATPSLSINGNNLSISGGNSILIPTSGTIAAINTSIVSTGVANTSVLSPNSFSIHVPVPSFSNFGPTTITGSYPNYTINSLAGTSYTNGSGIVINSGSVITNTAPDQTVVITGTNGIGVSGAYPNFTISPPATNNINFIGTGAAQISTLSANSYSVHVPLNGLSASGIASVSATGTNSYNINVGAPSFTNAGPTSITGAYPNYTINSTANVSYTNGSGISITSGSVITNTSPDLPVSITNGANIAVSGSYPNFTLSTSATLNTSLTQNGIVTITPAGTNSFVVGVPHPTFTPAGPTSISGTYPNLTITSPSTTTYTNGSGIAITSGSVISNTSPDVPVSITNGGNITVSGLYPNFTLSTTATPNTSLTQGGIVSITPSGTNSFIVSAPSPTFTPSGPTTISGTYPNLTITSPTIPASTPNTSVSSGGIVSVSNPVTNSFVVSAPSPTFTSVGPTAISGTYPNLTITSPVTETYTAGSGISISGGPNYTISASGSANTWSLGGNAGTNPSTNYIGTSDSQALLIKTNATERLRVTSAGNIGIGVTNPTATLQVNGTTRLVDGTQGANKVLTSDASGNASWENSSRNTAFSAYATAGQSILSTTYAQLLFGGEDFDSGNNFASNQYVAPSTGVYEFHATVGWAGMFNSVSQEYIIIYKNGFAYKYHLAGTTTAYHSNSISVTMNLNATDIITVWVLHYTPVTESTFAIAPGFYTYFSGHRLY